MTRRLAALLDGRLAAKIDSRRDIPFAILHWLRFPQPNQQPFFVTFHGSAESVSRARRRWIRPAPRKTVVRTVELTRTRELAPGDEVTGADLFSRR